MMNHHSNKVIGNQLHKMESTTNKPPHRERSPEVSRQDSSGTSLGITPAIKQTEPFYIMNEPPGKATLSGEKDLLTENGVHHTLNEFRDKKVKETLSSFLPNVPGINYGMRNLENSTLRSVIGKPPVCGKMLLPLNNLQLVGFRLHPGPLPEHYRTDDTTARKHKSQHEEHKSKDGVVPKKPSLMNSKGLETYEKKQKKEKRHKEDKKQKKQKKEKKRKHKSHSPEPPEAHPKQRK